ncbi:SubName: Full=Uncharacterized protein {ECO:0000313/EMBL:CCA71279.1} [Serendipita indica DSM 11827]|nr:SubName: Full=Uncharacterized protein {ECO:0000313/EMBL:CCA71279.1} [Serendipita indica DSM 11827]
MALPPPTNPASRPVDPKQLLDRSAREFLSRRDLDPRRRSTTPAPISSSNGYYTSNGYASPAPGNASSAVAAHRAMNNTLPPITSRTTEYSAQQKAGSLFSPIRSRLQLTIPLAADIKRSPTAVPISSSNRSIYPGHMLPHAPSRSNSSYVPYGNYANSDSRTNGEYHQPTPMYPSSTSPPSSPPYSNSRSPLSSSSIASPPPQSPASSLSSHRSHSQSYGYNSSSPPPHPHLPSSSGALTDYASSGRLVPSRHSRRTSHDVRPSSTSSGLHHHYSSSSPSSGYPRVGPALANNLPPVLPRPPNTSGATSGYPPPPRRSSTLGPGISSANGRSGRSIGKLTGIDDEDATTAVNTYYQRA